MERAERLRPNHPDQPVILVVEDDLVVRNLVRVILEKDGHFVLTAANGDDGLLLSRSWPFEIHLLLSDICMPIMSGVELANQIVKERPGIIVVLMSGYCEQRSPEFVFLRKPFALKQLSQTIKTLIPIGK